MQIATLRKELDDLVRKRNQLETQYRVNAIDEYDMEEVNAVAKIQKARLAPQKAKLLQSIHVAHVAVVSKQDEINASAVEFSRTFL